MVAEAVAQQLGYRNVYNIRGGILAWRRAGLPVENGRY
jgi:rhodanese-related sulfurtransferase